MTTEGRPENGASTVNIYTHRCEQFKQLYHYLDDKSRISGQPLNEVNEDDLVFLARLRVIPVHNPNYCIKMLSSEHGYNMDYWLQVYMDTLEDAVIEKNWEKEKVREELENVRSRLETHPNTSYPADGSMGQAKVSMKAQRDAYRWLLGEYHGDSLDENDLYSSNSQSGLKT